MNRLLQTIAAAMLIACYALPVRAEAPPNHNVKVYTGKRAKPRLDHEFWRDRSETYRGAGLQQSNVERRQRAIWSNEDAQERHPEPLREIGFWVDALRLDPR